MKLVKLAWNLLRVHVLKKRVPLFVHMLLTNRCNALCKYCQIPLRPKDEIPPERMIAILNEMAAAGVYRVALYGGEPLLRKDIHAIVVHAKKVGLVVHLYTNGILIDKYIETIKLVDGVFISVDGPEEHHDAYRGKGNHKYAIEAIEKCSQLVPVFINAVITKSNKEQIKYLHDISMKYDCLLNFQPVSNTPGMSAEISDYELTHDEFVACLREIQELKRGRSNIVFSERALSLLINKDPNVHKRGHVLGLIECWQGTTSSFMDADGNLYSCSQLTKVEKPLNLKDHTFAEAWDHLNRCSCEKCSALCSLDFQLWQRLDTQAVLNLVKLLGKTLVKKASIARKA